MARRRKVPACVLAVTLAMAGAGCEGTDSQAFWYSVSNGTEQAIIVSFGSWGDIRVDPGGTGHAVNGFGLYHGPILVLDMDCKVIHNVEATTQRGNLWLRPDGTVTLAETAVDSRALRLERTEQCASS